MLESPHHKRRRKRKKKSQVVRDSDPLPEEGDTEGPANEDGESQLTLLCPGAHSRFLLGLCCNGSADKDTSGHGLSVVPTDQDTRASLDLECACPPGKPSGSLAKYWSQRYRLFSRFDQGILLDEGKSFVAQVGLGG